MVELTIKGNPVTKKNSQRIFKNARTGRRFIVPSEQYEEYANYSVLQLRQQFKGNAIASSVNVKCLYYMKSKHKVDITNLMSATHDILVAAGVLEDDDFKIVVSVDGSRILFDSQNPRCEIYITDAENE